MSGVDDQVRLILERQCSDMGRRLFDALGRDAPFILFLFDFGAADSGHFAFFSAATLAVTRRMVQAWILIGVRRFKFVRGADVEEGLSLARTARDVARRLKEECPAGVGYALLLWDEGGPIAYLSSGDREDVRRLAREWLDKSGAKAASS
jgi:hypothetical protein